MLVTQVSQAGVRELSRTQRPANLKKSREFQGCLETLAKGHKVESDRTAFPVISTGPHLLSHKDTRKDKRIVF